MVVERLKPKESLGFLTWKVSRLMTNSLAARFVETGVEITVEQWRALIPLFKIDGMTQGHLCEILSQEKTGVSRLVAALEKRGLVRREFSRKDRRVKYIYITDKGRDLLDFSVEMVLAKRDDHIKHIDPKDLEICKRVLWQIIEPTLDDECLSCKDENDSRE
jgi:DNA-binding MarR family transcriptional regulator